jgi:DNA repair protein RadC
MTRNNALFVQDLLGDYQSAAEDEIIVAARQILDRRVRKGAYLESPSAARDFLVLRLAPLPCEVFLAVFLDAQHGVIEAKELFRGTLTQTSVYPREVVREALMLNAAAVIVAHNHPSGSAEPSRADECITSTLKSALALVDVRLIDHIVVAGGKSTSLAERGLL